MCCRALRAAERTYSRWIVVQKNADAIHMNCPTAWKRNESDWRNCKIAAYKSDCVENCRVKLKENTVYTDLQTKANGLAIFPIHGSSDTRSYWMRAKIFLLSSGAFFIKCNARGKQTNERENPSKHFAPHINIGYSIQYIQQLGNQTEMIFFHNSANNNSNCAGRMA